MTVVMTINVSVNGLHGHISALLLAGLVYPPDG